MNKLATSILLGFTLYSIMSTVIIKVMINVYFEKVQKLAEPTLKEIYLFISAYNIIFSLLFYINAFGSVLVSYFFYEFMAK